MLTDYAHAMPENEADIPRDPTELGAKSPALEFWPYNKTQRLSWVSRSRWRECLRRKKQNL